MNALAPRIAGNIAVLRKVTGFRRPDAIRLGASCRNSLLSFPTLFLIMAKKVTFYYHKDCEFCKDLRPLVKRAAKAKGLMFEQINVETCETRFCNSLEFVPTIVLSGKKLNKKQVEKFLGD